MSDSSAGYGDKQSIIEDLSRFVAKVDKDDLRVLADMHEASEALVRSAGPEGDSPDTGMKEQAVSLSNALEAVILRSTDDPEAVLELVAEQIRALARLCGLSEPDAPSASNDDASQKPVAQRLADIFDDEQSESGTGGKPDPPPRSPEAALDASLAEVSSEPPAASRPEAEPYAQQPLVIDASEHEFVTVFLEEAFEHIEGVESAVLEVERFPDDTAKIDDLFRPFHTIKGGAGFLNFRDVGSLTHEAETLLDQSRRGERKITPGLIDLIFDVVDILKAQFFAIRDYINSPSGDTVPQPPVVDMIRHLRDVVAGRVNPQGHSTHGGCAGQPVGENLVEQGVVAKEVVDFALESQKSGRTDKKTGEILMEAKAATARQVSQALRVQNPASGGEQKAVSRGEQSVRIDTGKLDALIEMMGELVIAQAQVSANSSVHEDPRLLKNVEQASKIVRDVQELAMGMRMIPIGGTFQRMARLVRDVSRKAGKTVELSISGEDTELDKNVIEQINDPLVHMVRNAVDHGVETPEERAAAGKEPTGRVHLGAFHHGGNIVIEIHDDGKGLDPKKLIAKGIEKGLVQPDEELSDQQAFQLVFAPGFSTAEKVTDISGRGVGMDVVRRNMEALRGRVDISSELGKGSTFSIRLPLTLAIIDGMIVRVGTEHFIIQTITVEQALRPTAEQITTVQQRGEMLNVRGSLIPMIQLGQLFGLTGRVDPCESMVVIAQSGSGHVGLVVEELIGQQQVVIKTLGERFKNLRGISGAAVLGDGRVGLILEVGGIEEAFNMLAVHTAPISHVGLRASKKDESSSNAEEVEALAGTPA